MYVRIAQKTDLHASGQLRQRGQLQGGREIEWLFILAALLDELADSAMVTDGNGMEGCPSPLRAVQIGGEDLTMFDGTNPTDGSEFLLDPDLTPDDA